MQAELALFTIVVTGEVHNPSILNPDFLLLRKILPEGWNGIVTQAITTPPFAVVAYSNNITITVETGKLQVADASKCGNPMDSPAVHIASEYVRALPHVRYKAVGINFHSMIEMSGAEDYLKQRFVKPGPWDSTRRPLRTVAPKLVYATEGGGKIIVSLDSGEAAAEHGNGNPKSVVVVQATFHRDCTRYPAENEVIGHLQHVADDWQVYGEVLESIFEKASVHEER